MMNYKARLKKSDFGYETHLLIYSESNDGFRHVVKPFVIERIDKYASPESTLSSHQDDGEVESFLQAICDLAFEEGIYPKQLKDKTDELKATKFHLEDMRSLVFKENK